MPNIRIALAISHAGYDLSRQDAKGAGDVVMMDESMSPAADISKPAGKPLSPAAQRALAEAEARRLAAAANAQPAPKEFQGRKGPDPTRYGDWENKGIASDF
jgi:hypothetical protein